jgi:hypothetical protein
LRELPRRVPKPEGQPDAIFAWPPSWPTHLGPSSRRAGGTDGSAAEPPPLNARRTSRGANTSSTTARAHCRPLVAMPDRGLGSSACPAFGSWNALHPKARAHVRDSWLLRTPLARSAVTTVRPCTRARAITNGSATDLLRRIFTNCRNFARISVALAESRPPRHEGDVPLRPSKDVVVLPFELEKHVLWAARRASLISSCG